MHLGARKYLRNDASSLQAKLSLFLENQGETRSETHLLGNGLGASA